MHPNKINSLVQFKSMFPMTLSNITEIKCTIRKTTLINYACSHDGLLKSCISAHRSQRCSNKKRYTKIILKKS